MTNAAPSTAARRPRPGTRTRVVSGYVSLSDVLCDPCQVSIVRDGWMLNVKRWEADECGLGEVLTCTACRLGVQVAEDAGDVIEASVDLSPARERLETAVHEAGHVVAALAVGMRLTAVEIDPDSEEFAGLTHRALDDCFEGTTIDFVATCWAGQQASLRWLVEKELDTWPNRISVRYSGSKDTLRAMADIRETLPDADVHVELKRGRRRADALVKQHWQTVLRLARWLVRERYVALDGVETVADLAVAARQACARTRRQPARRAA